jgi:glycosyltransferase involved in cell wall biosynthesis
MQSVTLLIPVYNEADGLDHNLRAILGVLDELQGISVRLLVVDDGSRDDSAAVVQRLSEDRWDVSLLVLNRNFGKEAAIYAGLSHAEGDAVIVMDSDLQHPPELIPRMIALWRDGFDVVEAFKTSRAPEPLTARLSALGFYALFRHLAGMNISNHTDYKLLDRKVVDVYRNLPERLRFFRGIVTWMGFPTAQLPYGVPARTRGTTRWSSWRLFKYSVSAVTAFSSAPLQLVTGMGLLTFLISVMFGSIALYDKLSGQAIGGFTTVILLLLIIGSVLMFSLGLLGVYVARIYEEVKARPSYLVDWRRSRLTPDDGPGRNSQEPE